MKTIHLTHILRAIALTASLSLFGLHGTSLHAKGNNKKGAPPTAASLVKDMKASVAFIAKNSKDINPKSKQAVPFYNSLKTVNQGIALMDAGIQKKSPDMLKGLDTAGRGVTELAATWGIIRGAHPKSQVGRGVKSLASAYEMYLTHFGPSVALLKKGGGKKGKITDAELAMIEKSGTQLEALLGNLEKVAATAKPKSYQSRMIMDLLGLVQKLGDIDGNDRGAYAKYQYQWGRLQQALSAYGNITKSYYPAYYKSWSALTPLASAMGSLFGSSAWTYYSGWDYSSVSIANYGAYYEETSITTSITETEESSFEQSLESYSEESATEEDAEDEEAIEEETDDEEDEDSLFEEVEDDADDEDGDGIADEDDDDDDNDGIADDEDMDDDGDGVNDEEDADDDEEEEMDEDDDDDGVADCCEGCCQE